MTDKSNKIKLFYSYSHADEKLRNSLETHLSGLQRNNLITEWHDRKILPGQAFEGEIDKNITDSDIILLLISPDFIQSNYCYEIELKTAMEMHETDRAIVIPIILRPTVWYDLSFTKLLMLPTDAKSVTEWDNQDLAWVNVVEGIRKDILKIQGIKKTKAQSAGFKPIKALLIEQVDSIDTAYQEPTLNGISTGVTTLDELINGVQLSELTTIAARPFMGKTDFAIQLMAYAAASEKRGVSFFSLRIPSDKIVRKLIEWFSHITTHKLSTGNLDDEEWPSLVSAVGILSEANIFIDDTHQMTLVDLKDKICQSKKENVSLIIIDSLHHLALSDNNINPADASRDLLKLSRELNVAIVVTISLSPDLENRYNKRPLVEDFGTWRSLEEDSDTIIFMYRDNYYNYSEKNREIVQFIVPKNSSTGIIGSVYGLWQHEFKLFVGLNSPSVENDEA